MATRILIVAAAGGLAVLLAQPVPAALSGNSIFEKRCTGCHAIDSQRAGPKLRGVFGRKAGSVDGFPYSNELKASGKIWDAVALDRWLADPDAMVPGTDMAFRVAKAEERAAIVEFLRTLR